MVPWVGRKVGGEVAEEPVREEDQGVGESVNNRRFNG